MPIDDDEVRVAALKALPNWSWNAFTTHPPQTRHLMRLAPNGWCALIAYLAGPSWVYQETARPEPVAQMRDELVRYLADAGVAEPPRAVEWVLCLPEGVTQRDVEDTCSLAALSVPANDDRARALAVHAALRVLLNGRMSPLAW